MSYTSLQGAVVALSLTVGLALGGCSTDSGGAAVGGGSTTEARSGQTRRPVVYTSCFPVHWLTERVAGEHADVTLILPAGEDPPEWTPPADIISSMQQADLIVINGAGFEGWLGTTTLPETKLVDTTAGVKDRFIEIEATTHSHGRDGEHSHAGTDPHTWSDPLLALAQAEAIQAALARTDPDHAQAYRASMDALATELRALDGAYEMAAKGYGGESLATSHPAFNYLAKRYGLTLIDFGFEPDVVPDDESVHGLERAVKDHGVERMLWEAQPTDEVRTRVEGVGVEALFFDPLEQPQGDAAYDYLAQARANVDRLKTMFPAAETATAPE